MKQFCIVLFLGMSLLSGCANEVQPYVGAGLPYTPTPLAATPTVTPLKPEKNNPTTDTLSAKATARSVAANQNTNTSGSTDQYATGWRPYRPDIGRFSSLDPAGSPNGPNRYNYCESEPVNNSDPTGTILKFTSNGSEYGPDEEGLVTVNGSAKQLIVNQMIRSPIPFTFGSVDGLDAMLDNPELLKKYFNASAPEGYTPSIMMDVAIKDLTVLSAPLHIARGFNNAVGGTVVAMVDGTPQLLGSPTIVSDIGNGFKNTALELGNAASAVSLTNSNSVERLSRATTNAAILGAGAYGAVGAARSLAGATVGVARSLVPSAAEFTTNFRAATGFESVIGATNRLGVQPYSRLAGTLPQGMQAHHLNQDAAFRGAIPTNSGASIGMRGNAFTELETPHYKFHQSMESFWQPYRNNSALANSFPTMAAYNQATAIALRAAGYSERDIDAAQSNQQMYGLGSNSLVPRIPSRMNQQVPVDI